MLRIGISGLPGTGKSCLARGLSTAFIGEEGFEAVLERRASSRVYDVKIDGDVEAKLVKLCCSEPPPGFAKWSLRLLADKMVELQYIDSISYVSVGNVLKKMNLSLGK